jgi:hypothetical protein
MLANKFASGLITAILCFSSLNTFASDKMLSSFDELLQALDSGTKVRAVVNMDKCKLIKGSEVVKVLSLGFNYDWYNHYILPTDSEHSKEVITTSKNIFSMTKIQDLGAINNYIQLHIFKDNSAILFGAILDPKTYEQKASASYSCTLGTSVILYNS